ncbi:MAG: hypothetical protein R6U84_01435, partial [Candidatus Cloacimonadales bacterium]
LFSLDFRGSLINSFTFPQISYNSKPHSSAQDHYYLLFFSFFFLLFSLDFRGSLKISLAIIQQPTQNLTPQLKITSVYRIPSTDSWSLPLHRSLALSVSLARCFRWLIFSFLVLPFAIKKSPS